VVGLVERYANKSLDAPRLRQLAAIPAGRVRTAARQLPKKTRRLSDEELASFQARYLEGATVAVLAEEFDIHRTTVMTLAKRLGMNRPLRTLSEEDVRTAAAFYQDGESLSVVAKRFGIGIETMRTTLLASGQELRPRGRPARPWGSRAM